jgi:hypothetical protein
MSDKLNNEKKISGWVESFLITILFIVISKLLHDPLSLNSPYPWIWFAPVFIALHYGLLPSQLSIILLLSDYLYKNPSQLYEIHFQLYLLGGFLMTALCAAWQGTWSKQLIYSNGISEYLQKRIQNIAYAYKLTSLAYKRLENNYIARPVTIRTSMTELREMLGNAKGENEVIILNRLLNILSLHCSLERAAIYPVKNNKIILEPITSIGVVKTPSRDNFLIQSCIENKSLTHVSADEILKGHMSDYLVGAPLIDQNNIIYALMLVEEMPFLSLNDENLATMNLLLQYFVEGNTVKNAELILNKFQDCPIAFANELQRLSVLEKKTRKDSAVEVFKIIDKSHEQDYVFRLKQEIRGLDSWWETSRNGLKYLLVLMPFTNREATESYKIRINGILLKEYGFGLNQNEIIFNSYQLSSSSDPVSLIEEILRQK